jgi:hypothetical protein
MDDCPKEAVLGIVRFQPRGTARRAGPASSEERLFSSLGSSFLAAPVPPRAGTTPPVLCNFLNGNIRILVPGIFIRRLRKSPVRAAVVLCLQFELRIGRGRDGSRGAGGRLEFPGGRRRPRFNRLVTLRRPRRKKSSRKRTGGRRRKRPIRRPAHQILYAFAAAR